MKKAKRVFKFILFVLLICMACIGVGLSGGVPIPFNNAKRDPQKDKIELVEKEDENLDSMTKR